MSRRSKSTRRRKNAKPGARTRRSGAGRSTLADALPTQDDGEVARAKAKFVRGLIARGESAPAGESLPPGATHELAKGDRPRPKRRRFSTH